MSEPPAESVPPETPQRPIRRITTSVPGKLILAGEHAVVYGRPALVAAVGLRLHTEFAGPVSPTPGGPSILLDAPVLGPRREIPWRQAIDHARAARELWHRYAQDPAGNPFPPPPGGEPAHVVVTALGEAAMFLGENSGPPIEVSLHGDLPVGRGFGSSAAAAVAVLAGYLALRNAPGDQHDLARLALEVERRQHGLPSGVDAATVLQGGVLQARRRGDNLEVRPLAARSDLLDDFAVYDSGRPPESTGEVVAAVRSRLAETPALDRLLDRIDEATAELLAVLTHPPSRVPDPHGTEAPPDPRPALTACQRALEELGVVPDPVARLARRIEAAGGAAKISGAGSLAGPGAGSLLVYHPEPAALEEVGELAELRRHPVELGASGLTVAAAEGDDDGR